MIVRVVHCDNCSSSADDWHCTTAKQAREVAAGEGWVYRKGKDLCPECS